MFGFGEGKISANRSVCAAKVALEGRGVSALRRSTEAVTSDAGAFLLQLWSF